MVDAAKTLISVPVWNPQEVLVRGVQILGFSCNIILLYVTGMSRVTLNNITSANFKFKNSKFSQFWRF